MIDEEEVDNENERKWHQLLRIQGQGIVGQMIPCRPLQKLGIVSMILSHRDRRVRAAIPSAYMYERERGRNRDRERDKKRERVREKEKKKEVDSETDRIVSRRCMARFRLR